MALVNQTQSAREVQGERREKRVEEAAEREFERTVAAAEEHREAVKGDAVGSTGEQRVAPRHQQGAVVNSMTTPMSEKAQARARGSRSRGGERDEGGKRNEGEGRKES